MNKHRIMVLNPANKYQIIWQCHNRKNITYDFQYHQFFHGTNVSYVTERQLSTISYSLASENYFVKLYNRSTLMKLDLSCDIEVHHVGRLL